MDDGISIPLSEIAASYIRASGPGGQHVNKSSTAVQLRFDIDNASTLDEAIRARLRRLAGNRVNKDGELIVTAQRFRSREQNYRDGLERIGRLVARAATAPKKRRKTRPSRAAKKRRLDDKRRRSRVKQLRGRPGRHD
ncbi:MAG: aminoacyl-tRNA hydrolase [Gammaproteobacteria bacterium]|nr:aminoacyl-tRNA hydrolase [Gammaproteobacteria bacterium]NND60307.1 aminoacyl-tRNA hydrolase [Gammaproteobacteria bacterium]